MGQTHGNPRIRPDALRAKTQDVPLVDHPLDAFIVGPRVVGAVFFDIRVVVRTCDLRQSNAGTPSFLRVSGRAPLPMQSNALW